ncbi:MAG TPA: YtxH domain-containing protein [Gemmatimonadales bacterium]|nr:YtxH domain-containing protein [Gemmatimonadales bacterium]
MKNQDDYDDVVYVVREQEAPLKYLFWGAAIGAGLALLFAPSSGTETRRQIRSKARRFRALAEEKYDEFEDRLADGSSRVKEFVEDGVEDLKIQAGELTDAVKGAGSTARDELERRLKDARARRRGQPEAESAEEVEPVT